MDKKIEFDFKNNMAILDGRQVTIDYLYKQLLNELNMPECIGFSYDEKEIIFNKTNCSRNIFSYKFKNEDRVKVNNLLQKLDEVNTQKIINKLKKLKEDLLKKKYMDGSLYLLERYNHEYCLIYSRYYSRDSEHFVEVFDKDLAKPEIKELVDEVINLHDNNEEWVFEYNFKMRSSAEDSLHNFIVGTKDDMKIEKRIFDNNFEKPDILKKYLNKHRFKVLGRLLTHSFINDIWNLLDNDVVKAKIVLLVTGLILGCIVELDFLGTISITSNIFLGTWVYYGFKKVWSVIRSNKNINKMIKCLDEKYNLVDVEVKEPAKEIEKQPELAQLSRKTQKLDDPFLRSLYLNIITMKNYPEIDWSYEAETIEDLSKKYVEAKKSNDSSSYELLIKYPNFLEIANTLDSLIEEKTKEQSNDIGDLDIINTELDGLKSVTLDTNNIRKLNLK
ncbi:MAG TPA: hypothetical protein DHU33_01190 [Firmicutes bacterium]|nr:hypothetical protein [Bacillota bacterium]